ncbi:MAG TPA: efflux RND transporter periplasmic adaptor subunit [Pirellulaceae bacterium]|nr:efflux RND transporter periplasmic adaptor subunit [Pirellulaceae bacterium]
MTFKSAALLASALLLYPSGVVPAQEIRLPNVLVKLIEEADVPALETGVLETFAVGEGGKVQAGDLLVKTQDIDAKLLVERHRRECAVASKQSENRAKVLSAQASLQIAKSELKRAHEARARIGNAVSDAELDRLQLAVSQAEFSIQQAEHDVEVARLDAELKQAELHIAEHALERHQIIAPFAGVVAQVYRRRGEWVEPGEKTLRLVRTDRLKAEGYLPLDKARQVAIGATATLTTDDATASTYRGKVTFISPEADPFNGQVRFVAEIENPKGTLKPGQKGNLSLLAAP